MGTNKILLDAFERIKEVVYDVSGDLDEDQLTFSPDGGGNSIAWLIWHLTRIQDDHISDLAGREQTWTADGWHGKFGLPFDESATGYGHSADEVRQVKAPADLLTSYYDAVHQRTIKFINSLNDDDYERIIDTSWDPPVSMAVRIVSVISDDLQHCGQAAYVKGLLKEQK